jgi:hypothetical protein
MPNVGQQNVLPGASPVAIAPGYHDGTGTVAGDPDLVAANIASGADIFGVAGTALPATIVKTGQTTAYTRERSRYPTTARWSAGLRSATSTTATARSPIRRPA